MSEARARGLPLVLKRKEEPPGTPPQRGAIDRSYKYLLEVVLHTARLIGTKVLKIEDPLETDIELTPQSLRQFQQAFRGLVQAGKVDLCHLPAEEIEQMVQWELFGLGPMERFLRRSDVSEVMVNGPYIMFIEIGGKLQETGHKFLDDAHVERVIQRIVRPLGREIGPHTPMVDARLADGSRVNAVVSPCALDGPSVTIRKFGTIRLRMSELVELGSMSVEMARFLSALVESRHNIIVSGGTGSGKTTLINALSQFINDSERVVTIEDAAELMLNQRNVVRLESKKPSTVDPTEITIRGCLVNALRMRPERILIGECRSAEALDMLQAMNTGHDGSMTTVHANDPRQAISRLETLALMSGLDLPVLVLRKQLATAVQYIVQASRLRDGSRRVTHITEVQGMEGETVSLSDIFTFKETGVDENGRIIGEHTAHGVRPLAMLKINQIGIQFPKTFFNPKTSLR